MLLYSDHYKILNLNQGLHLKARFVLFKIKALQEAESPGVQPCQFSKYYQHITPPNMEKSVLCFMDTCFYQGIQQQEKYMRGILKANLQYARYL